MKTKTTFGVTVLGVAALCGSQIAYAGTPVGTPGAAWVTIFDGTVSEPYTISSSLNDTGYITPSDTGGMGVLGGAYATQAGAAAFDVQEGPGVLGQASLDFEYADPTPLADGTIKIVNFNISEPSDPSKLSDTLSITFTGHNDGTNNMSIDLHYLSDNDLGLVPPLLPSAIAITETGQYQDLSAAIKAATGLSNFNLQFTSLVLACTPKPNTTDIATGLTNPLFAGTAGSCPTGWICGGSPAPGVASYAPGIAQYPGGPPFSTSASSPTIWSGSGVIRQNTPLKWTASQTYLLDFYAGVPDTYPNGTTSVAGWPQTVRVYLTAGPGFAQVAAFDIPSPGKGNFVPNPLKLPLPSNSAFLGQSVGVLIFVNGAFNGFSANFDIACTP
ncbi:MAG: hypothetical protein ABSG41_24555 [Bryobacteraceae bacterium]|jgi:hypothetical protein